MAVVVANQAHIAPCWNGHERIVGHPSIGRTAALRRV